MNCSILRFKAWLSRRNISWRMPARSGSLIIVAPVPQRARLRLHRATASTRRLLAIDDHDKRVSVCQPSPNALEAACMGLHFNVPVDAKQRQADVGAGLVHAADLFSGEASVL